MRMLCTYIHTYLGILLYTSYKKICRQNRERRTVFNYFYSLNYAS
jgi:hypothetical protein